MTSNHRVLFCDLGNVILPFSFDPAIQKIAKLTGKTSDQVRDFFFQPGLQENYETGRISSKAFLDLVRKGFNLSISDKELAAIWNEIFSENRPVIEWLGQIKDRISIWGISNTNELHFNYVYQHYPIIRSLSGWILSYQVGFRKPHPEIYRAALAKVGVPAEEAFFVDDRLENVEAAAKIGIPATLFTDLANLIQTLINRGHPV